MAWLREASRCSSAHYFRVEPFTLLGVFLGAMLGAGVCSAWVYHKIGYPRELKEK